MLILLAKSVFPFAQQRLSLGQKFGQCWLTERHRDCDDLLVFGKGRLKSTNAYASTPATAYDGGWTPLNSENAFGWPILAGLFHARVGSFYCPVSNFYFPFSGNAGRSLRAMKSSL